MMSKMSMAGGYYVICELKNFSWCHSMSSLLNIFVNLIQYIDIIKPRNGYSFFFR
uniref:Uncharacterized protein n=1 Tax=Setaria italica TaxID=4555 RepID=K3ZGH3_SETIT